MSRTAHPPIAPASALTVYTLGRFAVYRGNALIEEPAWQRQKAKKLFKLLLLAPQRHMLKDQVLDLLWPDKPPETAANNLHRTLFTLRRVLQPDLVNAALSHYLWFKDDILALNPAAIAWVDAEHFEHLMHEARLREPDLDRYGAALALYAGDFLPEDVHEAWSESRRHALQQQYTDVLKRLAALHSARGSYQQAIEYLCLLLRVEPTDEEVQRALMRLYAQTGSRHQALRLYQRSREVLRADLGVDPSVQTTALYEAILHEQFPVAHEQPALPDAPRAEPPPSEEPHATPLIGREAEMRQLAEYLQRACHGSGNVIFLIGEQGVGKTRTGEEFAAHARARGMHTQYGAAFEGEGRLLYAPFVEAMRKGLTPALLCHIRQRLGPLAEDLARLLPELAAQPGRARPEGTRSIDRLAIETGDQQRRRLFEAIAMTFAVFAEHRPTLVVLDNLHAAGESSLQLLHYLARRIAQQRILFLCTVDEARLHRGAAITLLLGELQRNRLAQRLQLTRLTPEDVTRMCGHLLDTSVRHSRIPRTVYDLTEGNPFLVKELVLSLVRLGKIEQRGDGWQLLPDATSFVPAGVQEIVGIRLGHLSNDAYRLLGAAAAIGNGFSYELLQAAAQGSRGTLLDTFDEILEERLVVPTETGYSFEHAMIRQVVYTALAPERRAWLHEQVARALERLAAGHLDEHAASLAFHFERAGDGATAFRYLLRAGDWARGAYALREAREQYDHAHTLYDQHPEIADVETLTGLLDRRSQTYLALSDFDLAIGDLEQLLRAYDERGMRARAGETLYQLGLAHYWAHRLIKAAAYLDQALAAADTMGYDELGARVLRLRDILHSTQGQVADSVPDAAAIEATHDSLHAEEYWGYAMLAHLHCDFASALRHAQSCIEVGEATGNTFLTLGGHFILGMSQANLGDYQRAVDSLQGALKLSEATGDRFWRARLRNTMGWIYRELFHLEQALHCDQASLELARASTPRLTEAEGNALANLATTNLLLERYAAARAYVDEGLALSEDAPFMRWRYFTRLIVVQGQLALAAGTPSEALAAAEVALDLARSTKAPKNTARSCLLRGSALLAMGDRDGGRAAMAQALQVARELRSQHMIWSAHLALAELEGAAGQADAARVHYHAAWAIVEHIAGRLTDPRIRDRFLDGPPIRTVRAHVEV